MAGSKNKQKVSHTEHQYPEEEQNADMDMYRSEDEQKKNPAPPNTAEQDLSTSRYVGQKLSAPPDVTKVNIKVDWPDKLPERWERLLQKALQSWCNLKLSGLVKEECNIVNLKPKPDSCEDVAVEISPSKALDTLKKMTKISLLLKETKQEVTVHFMIDEKKQKVDMFVTASIDVEKFNAEVQAELRKKFEKFCVVNKLSVSGSLNLIQKFYEEVCEIVEEEKNRNAAGAVRNVSVQTEISGSTETSGVQQALTVPVPQHWDLQKEIRQIEHDCGVNISGDILFSVTAKEKTTTDSVHKAVEKLVKLVTSSNSSSAKSTKLLAEKINLMTETSEDAMDTENAAAFKSGAALEMAIKLEMDIKDTQASLEMDEIHWKLVQVAFEKQVSDIQHKYGVRFDVETSQGSKAKVRATSLENSLVNLEIHALRALTHLYQRVATSTVTCELKDPADSKTVAAVLEVIYPQHPCVGAGEQYGSWKLIGLREHLLPAIAGIEKLIGKPVFDDKAKQMLSYPGSFPQISRHTWGQQEKDAGGWAPGTDPRAQMDSDRSEFYRKQLGDKGSAKGKESEEDNCPVCMERFKNKTKLKCGHEFCKECLKMAEKSLGQICSLCKNVYGLVKGSQPPGTMTSHIWQTSLPGFSNCGTIYIDYFIPDGTQTEEHPNPGQKYHGAQHSAYLPNNKEGRVVLKLLEKAFDQRLIFTVGRSTTTGVDNVVTWNDIHHKTNTHGGPERYGYPDPDYLQRVKAELKAKGIE